MTGKSATEILEVIANDPGLPGASEVPGFAVGVSNGGERAERGFGVARLGSDTPVTPATAFGICSISKTFTATLAMTLVEAGKLELDRPVVDVLEGFRLSSSEATGAITLRHLLTHTGGFACELGNDLSAFGSGEDAVERALPSYASLPQWTPPGGPWGYCNTGYWLIAAIVSRVTGDPFEQQMFRRVLKPLALRRTAYAGLDGSLADAEGNGEVATPHPTAHTDGSIEPNTALRMPRVRNASGGLRSTVGDLLQYAEVHMGSRTTSILTGDTLRAMQEPLASIGTPHRWQGLGWEIGGEEPSRLVGHDGSYGGFESMLMMIPSRKLALAVLTNSDHGWRVCQSIRSTVLRLGFAVENDTSTIVTASSSALQAFTGRYDLVAGSVLVGVDRGALVVERDEGSGDCERYLPTDDGAFVLECGTDGDRLSFPRNAGEPVALIRIDGRLGRRR